MNNINSTAQAQSASAVQASCLQSEKDGTALRSLRILEHSPVIGSHCDGSAGDKLDVLIPRWVMDGRVVWRRGLELKLDCFGGDEGEGEVSLGLVGKGQRAKGPGLAPAQLR